MSPKDSTDDLAGQRECQHLLDATVHHLRAPLRGIGTSAALLGEEWKDRFDERSKTLLRVILEGVTKIDNLAKSLADYSMVLVPESLPFRPLPLDNMLETALAALRGRIRETGATVQTAPLPRLEVHPDQLSLVFRALLSNALEHSQAAEPPHIRISASRRNDEWQFSVSDNGVGIPFRYQQQIFEPFERLDHGGYGVGLGLTICKKIVEAHGGRIWAEARDSGATFVFTLPAGQFGTE